MVRGVMMTWLKQKDYATIKRLAYSCDKTVEIVMDLGKWYWQYKELDKYGHDISTKKLRGYKVFQIGQRKYKRKLSTAQMKFLGKSDNIGIIVFAHNQCI